MRWVIALAVLTSCSFEKPLEQAIDAPEVTADAMAFDARLCPDNFIAVGDLPHRYRWAFVYDTTADTWEEARARCAVLMKTNGYAAHLVTFETMAERDAVLAAYSPANNYRWFWSGAFKTGGNWRTILDEPYTPAFADGTVAGDTTATARGIGIGKNANGTTPGDLDLDRTWGQLTICECDGRTGTVGP